MIVLWKKIYVAGLHVDYVIVVYLTKKMVCHVVLTFDDFDDFRYDVKKIV